MVKYYENVTADCYKISLIRPYSWAVLFFLPPLDHNIVCTAHLCNYKEDVGRMEPS